jgi:hypothetical protein
MKKDNQAGFSIPHMILLLLLASIIGFTGWRVYDAQRKTSKTLDNAANSQNATKQEAKIPAAEIPNDYIEYKNEDIGFRFIYPKEWGMVSVANNSNAVKSGTETGNRYIFTFSMQDSVTVVLADKDLEVQGGKDGQCYAGGILTYTPFTYFGDDFTADTTQGRFISGTSSLLYDKNDTQLREDYYPGTGMCSGFYIEGQKKFEASKKYNGANISYFKEGDYIDDENKVQQLVQDYKKDKTLVASDVLRTQIIEVTKSLSPMN